MNSNDANNFPKRADIASFLQRGGTPHGSPQNCQPLFYKTVQDLGPGAPIGEINPNIYQLLGQQNASTYQQNDQIYQQNDQIYQQNGNHISQQSNTTHSDQPGSIHSGTHTGQQAGGSELSMSSLDQFYQSQPINDPKFCKK
jgi:hypothetical protein